MGKKTVVIGLIGPVLDSGGRSINRWDRWRPTVSVGQQSDLLVDRFELLSQERYMGLAKTVAADFRQVSPQTEMRIRRMCFKDPWDFESVYGELLDFAKAYPFDTEREDYLVHITTGTHVMQICLFLLVESRIIPAKILQTGRTDPRDPAGEYAVIDLDLSKYDRLADRFRAETREGIHYLKAGIETGNAAYNRMIEQIEKVSLRSSDPILLTGPSGVGKTRLARLIYDWKKKNRRVSGAFVEVNCATLRGDAAMSALFGHRKGAYTGAAEARKGLLAAASGGLLFLDEVGELGADEQAMLLRAIEDKRFYPLGSDEETESDFQLICGTNQDLRARAAEGKFRADLLARINLWSFEMPGLRDRPEDIAPNLRYELERASQKLGKLVRMNREAEAEFLAFAASPGAAWSANFRDLAGAATRMAVLSDSGRITVSDVKEEEARLERGWRTDSGAPQPLVERVLGEAAGSLDLFDSAQLECVLGVCRRSKTLSEAGRALFGRSLLRKKSTNDADRLRKYLAGFGLSWKGLQEAFSRTRP